MLKEKTTWQLVSPEISCGHESSLLLEETTSDYTTLAHRDDLLINDSQANRGSRTHSKSLEKSSCHITIIGGC